VSGQSRTIRKRRRDILGLGLIIVSLLLGTGFGIFYWRTSRAETRVNPTTMCPESGPEGLTVLLIDATDAITPVQRASLHNEFERLVGRVPVHSAIEVYTVDQVSDRVLLPTGERICNPGRDGSFWTQNPRLIENRWRERFWEPLQKWELQAVDRQPTERSPILEAVQSVAVTEFQREALVGKPRTLVIVSDLLQHTPGLSHYRAVPSFEEFSRSDYYATVRTSWSGVVVEVIYITRPGTPQGSQHLEFWREYFAGNGGSLNRVTTF
jgi:hypothetical protein